MDDKELILRRERAIYALNVLDALDNHLSSLNHSDARNNEPISAGYGRFRLISSFSQLFHDNFVNSCIER